MPFCRNCGTPNHHQSNQCTRCGSFLNATQQMNHTTPLPVRKGMAQWKAMLFAIVPLSICGLFGMFAMFNSNSPVNTPDAPATSRPLVSTPTTNDNKSANIKSKAPTSAATTKNDNNTNSNKSSSDSSSSAAASNENSTSTEGKIIGNKRSKIYHWPGCPNYDEIASYNREYFETREEAEAAGYRAARNCGGSSSGDTSPKQSTVSESPKSNPSGATALCRDGSLSYSAHRRGTCSHHGGVAIWY